MSDAATIVAELTSMERLFILASPLDRYADPAVIAHSLGGGATGHRFAMFAVRHRGLFEREVGSSTWKYRLSALGREVRRQLEGEHDRSS